MAVPVNENRPALRRTPRLLRFGLASMLLLMNPLGLGFVWLRHYLINRHIDWTEYSAAELDRHLGDGRTVLVNFYANWDMTSAMIKPTALETPQVTRWIRSHGVIAMQADYTNHNPQVDTALRSISQRQVPVVAIYPASSQDDPIILVGVFTEKAVIEALQQAEHRRK